MAVKTFNELNVRGRRRVSKSKLIAFFEYKGQRTLSLKSHQRCSNYTTTRVHYVGKENDIVTDYDDLCNGLRCLPDQQHTDHTVMPNPEALRVE